MQIASNYTLFNQFGAIYQANKTGPWTAGPPDGNAFPALSVLTNMSLSIITKAQTQRATDWLPADVHPNVLAGFDAQRQLLITALQDPKRAAYELLNFNYGAFSNVNMRPFSRGTIKVSSVSWFHLLKGAHCLCSWPHRARSILQSLILGTAQIQSTLTFC